MRIPFCLLLAISLCTLSVASANYCGATPYCSNGYCQLDFDLDFEFGYYNLEVPEFSYGEILSAVPPFEGIGPIPDFVNEEDRVQGFYPRGAISIFLPCISSCGWFDNFRFELSAFYFEKTIDNDVPNFPLSGFAFPFLDGSGDFLATPAAGIPTFLTGVKFEELYRYSGVGFKFASDFYDCFSNFTFMPFFEFDYNTLHQGYEIEVNRFTGVLSARDFSLNERLDTRYFDFGLGLGFNYLFSKCFPALTFFGDAAGFASFANTELRATASAIVNPDTLQFFDLKKETEVFTGKFRGRLGIGYAFSPWFRLALMGQVDYFGYLPGLRNPHRLGTFDGVGIYDGSVQIVEESATNYAAVVKITINLF